MTGRWSLRSRLTSAAIALLLVVALVPGTSLVAHSSAWAGPSCSPRPPTLSGQLERLEHKAARITAMIELMEGMAARFRQAQRCISWLPVTEYGDRDHDFGYHYDERDGTDAHYRPALAVKTGPGRPDYMFLAYSQRPRCQSAPTKPGTPGSPGTADPAWTGVTASRSGAAEERPKRRSVKARLARLERTLPVLERRARALLAMSERFDEWESCLTWVGVSEYGDPDGQYGFRYDRPGGRGYMPGLAVDVSEWDDPDYTLLAFAGRDRPFRPRECRAEPGESVD